MRLLGNKFTHAYASGANAIAIQVDHHKIKRYILEYSDLRHIGVCHDDECECGCMDSHLHETETIRNEVMPSDIVSDTWITVLIDERLYAIHKPFFEIIYDGDISLLRIEIEENYDDFVGFDALLVFDGLLHHETDHMIEEQAGYQYLFIKTSINAAVS